MKEPNNDVLREELRRCATKDLGHERGIREMKDAQRKIFEIPVILHLFCLNESITNSCALTASRTQNTEAFIRSLVR